MKKFALLLTLLAVTVTAQQETRRVNWQIPDDPKEAQIHEDRIKNATSSRGSRISGGYTASITQFPFVAEMSISTSTGGGFLCTASLISNRWIAGASHCISMANVASIRAFLGSNDRQANRYTAWADYSVYLLTNGEAYPDIALIHLNADVPFSSTIQPIRVVSYQQKDFRFEGYTATAIGWGGDGSGGFPRYLQYTPAFYILQKSDCNLDTGSYTICSNSQTSSLVGGDSGGPLIIYQNGNPVLIGVNVLIVTWADQRRQGSTRISSFLDFIRDTTGVAYY